VVYLRDSPLLVFVIALAAFWFSAKTGASFGKKQSFSEEASRAEFSLLLGGTITLLALIIGFTFSMAVSRYDQRKNYEAEEANAIGTEHVRASLLPAADAARVRGLLKNYVDQRIRRYTIRSASEIQRIDAETARLQSEMWAAVATAALVQSHPAMALVVSGMNDVLNSQGYTQAAWWNRIPAAAWILVMAISIFCNFLVGYGGHRRSAFVLVILPIALSVSLFFIADIDSPQWGLIRIEPQNLESVAEALRSP
jgi:hypothetical protein